jgi:hypothetical protein
MLTPSVGAAAAPAQLIVMTDEELFRAGSAG